MPSLSERFKAMGRATSKNHSVRPAQSTAGNLTPSHYSSSSSSFSSSDKSNTAIPIVRAKSSSFVDDAAHGDINNNNTGFQRTSNGCLYTKDIDTIFSMLMLSLNLTPEGPKTLSFFSKSSPPFSFSIEDAVTKIQSMAIRIISGSTRTTITCNVSAQSAILFVERFMSARLLHCPSDRTRLEPKPGIFLQPTAKGVHFLDRFCSKNGIQLNRKTTMLLLKSNHNSMQCFSFDRSPVTDSILKNDAFVYLLFQRVMGAAPNVYAASNTPDEIPVSNSQRYSIIDNGHIDLHLPQHQHQHQHQHQYQHPPSPPHQKPQSVIASESPYAHRYFTNPTSDALSQYYISTKGVRLFQNKRVSKSQVEDYCFTGRAIWQWLLDCTDLVYQSEAYHLVNLFLIQSLIEPVAVETSEPKSKAAATVVGASSSSPSSSSSKPTVTLDKHTHYRLTDTGKYLVTWREYDAQPVTPILSNLPQEAYLLHQSASPQFAKDGGASVGGTGSPSTSRNGGTIPISLSAPQIAQVVSMPRPFEHADIVHSRRSMTSLSSPRSLPDMSACHNSNNGSGIGVGVDDGLGELAKENNLYGTPLVLEHHPLHSHWPQRVAVDSPAPKPFTKSPPLEYNISASADSSTSTLSNANSLDPRDNSSAAEQQNHKFSETSLARNNSVASKLRSNTNSPSLSTDSPSLNTGSPDPHYQQQKVRNSSPPKMTLRKTLEDAAVSWLFSQYLSQNHCEENLLFYKDLTKFLIEFEKLSLVRRKAATAAQAAQVAQVPGQQIKQQKQASALQRYNTQVQLYSQACKNSIYVMYNRFLAPSAPCELNIDSQSRKVLVDIITMHLQQPAPSVVAASKSSAQDEKAKPSLPPIGDAEMGNFSAENLYKVSLIFQHIKIHVYRTMENDSLPKFLNSELYLNGMKSISAMNKNNSGSLSRN